MNLDSQIASIQKHTGLTKSNIKATLSLFQEGCTVPFIARYRKEQTGGLDEVEIISVRESNSTLLEFQKRRDSIISTLTERNLLTNALDNQIHNVETTSELEDLYLPFKQKRKTKGATAKEQGLLPLAQDLLSGKNIQPERFINPEKEISSATIAIAGARDIVAEELSHQVPLRRGLRRIFMSKATLTAKVKRNQEEEGQKFKDYFDFSQLISKVPPHRLLAILRGEKLGYLKVSILPQEQDCLNFIIRIPYLSKVTDREQLNLIIVDGYRRLLRPALELETRKHFLTNAEEMAIQVFAENVRQLLLSPALGQHATMGIDPGFRTGSKLACLDEFGKLLSHATIYPFQSKDKQDTAVTLLNNLIQKHSISAIAIGNGTGGRETLKFVQNNLSHPETIITLVNEDGASIYSASETARKEFPELDITIRGAISIGRRLQDPLAELVKIEPKSIGVGQYQHDVNQTMLKNRLDDIVINCVNQVGIELNSASRELLSYVSGLGPTLADRIVNYRELHGKFSTRAALLSVPRLGKKAFEQCAGFLRIRRSPQLLDNTAVHPEQYDLVHKMAKNLNVTPDKLVNNNSLLNSIDLTLYINDQFGLPTLEDIITELKKPGRDPRSDFSVASFSDDIQDIKDLEPGIILTGIITNITHFGAFVDIGVHQDGLVHISELADRFIKDPTDVVTLQQQVQVKVLEVDIKRKRIALSIKQANTTC